MVSLFFQQPLAWAWSELGDLVGPGQVDRLENFQPFAVADENPPVSDIALAELERIADLRQNHGAQCRSELAREKRKDTALIQDARVIVDVLREQARSYIHARMAASTRAM